ncbi:MAG TPA: DUF2254 domain-containing protein [Halanaerobiales bacterium]|nr:DUF2254 domain-containing protein [Halanaerobiales bacterium]
MKVKFFQNLKNKLYFIPGSYGLGALILSFIIITVDNQFGNVLVQILPNYFFTSVDLARDILSTLAGSLFGMITISFSTIMVVLTMYSSQFSPRTVQDFLRSKMTLKVLGVFIGGFIYSIITLLFMKDAPGSNAVFSAFFGVIIAIICLGYFVVFIHHAANSVQVNILIEKLRDEVIELVNRIEERNNNDDRIQNESPDNLKEITTGEPKSIYANKSGYIQDISDLKLTSKAGKENIVVRADKMIGDYVTENSVIFSVWDYEGEIEDLDLLKYVIIDSERSKENDIEFGLLKLTEVALKAISPGINDPNTAVFCINQLGWILSRIAVANLENTYYYDEEDNLRFILEDISFGDLLYKTFYQLRYYGNRDVSVAGALLDSLLIIAEGSPRDVKEKIWHFSSFILAGFDENVLEDEDKLFLNKKIKRLSIETDKGADSRPYFELDEKEEVFNDE